MHRTNAPEAMTKSFKVNSIITHFSFEEKVFSTHFYRLVWLAILWSLMLHSEVRKQCFHLKCFNQLGLYLSRQKSNIFLTDQKQTRKKISVTYDLVAMVSPLPSLEDRRT